MNAIASLLSTFILASINREGDAHVVRAKRDELGKATGRDFGSDVNKWVDWYMKTVTDPDEREIVRVAYEVFKTRKKLEDAQRRLS